MCKYLCLQYVILKPSFWIHMCSILCLYNHVHIIDTCDKSRRWKSNFHCHCFVQNLSCTRNKSLHTACRLTLSCAIVQIRTIRRDLQKNGQRTFAWVLGSLWWLDQEREQHGRHFVSVWSIVVKFSIFYQPQRHANSNNGDGRRRSFSFGYIFGDFSR